MNDDRHESEETEQRLQKILLGAFNGAPTPLKNIPTHFGKKRAGKKIKTRDDAANAKIERPET